MDIYNFSPSLNKSEYLDELGHLQQQQKAWKLKPALYVFICLYFQFLASEIILLYF